MMHIQNNDKNHPNHRSSKQNLYIGYVNKEKIFVKPHSLIKSHEDMLKKYPELKNEFFDSLAFRYRNDLNEWYFWDKNPGKEEKFLMKNWSDENFGPDLFIKATFRKIMFCESFKKSHYI